MKNLYTIDCGIYPKDKIIKILKYNNFHFFPDNLKPEEGFGEYISFSEDKMWFIQRAIILNKIIIGSTYREDTNDSAFKIYFPNQVINHGFNYNAEFSKILIGMNDFEMNSSNPIVSINLHKKNIDKLINENDITFENTQIRASKRYKPVNFEKTKSKGIQKLFLYKQKDFFMVIGWILQGRRNRNTVIYNKAFTEFLMGIESIDLKTPEDFDLKRTNKKDGLCKGKTYKENGNIGGNHNPKSYLEDKTPVLNIKDIGKQGTDYIPNIDQINIILDKINKTGINSLSSEDLQFLNNSGKI